MRGRVVPEFYDPGVTFESGLYHAPLHPAAPAVALVGVHSAIDPAAGWPDMRSREYMPGQDRRRFNAHMRFVVGEVMPWATGRLGVAAGPWLVAGFSNGAVWSIAAGQRLLRPVISVQQHQIGAMLKQ